MRRVDGVSAIGPVGLSVATVILPADREPLDVSLVGVEPGLPGEPPALRGRGLKSQRGYETVIDRSVAEQAGIQLGERITIKTIQGTEEVFYDLTVVGISDGQQYFFLPSIFVPYLTWDRVRPQSVSTRSQGELASNIVVVRLDGASDPETTARRLETQVGGIEVVDKETAYEAQPGYQAQQSTLNTQRGFTLLIGVLVIGGFFQIQTLQKVPRIGMLKAIGASNFTVAAAVVLQILAVTLFGVALGSLGTFGLSLGMPADIPIRFTAQAAGAAVLSLLVIGPIGGLVSVRLALKVEPLLALGL